MEVVTRPYADRVAAGDALARGLARYAGRGDVVVLGLPRGGVPVAARVAEALDAPLDALVVGKIRVPGQPELAAGAVAGIGASLEIVRNQQIVERAGLSDELFGDLARAEAEQVQHRQSAFRGLRPPAVVAGRTVVVVDDGLATGATMRAAVTALRRCEPDAIVVAVPIGAAGACADLARLVDHVVCPWTPARFRAVAMGYTDFSATSADEVRALLAVSR